MSIFDEFSDRFSGRYFGKYRGVVSRIDDPKKMGRIMAKVPVVLGTDSDIGWALPTPPVGGGKNVGFIAHPAVGDYVWVEFEEGDPEKALWSAGPWPLGVQKKSFMPNHGKGEPDNTDYSMREFGNLPPSQFQGEYGKVYCLQGHDGSFFEMDGTDGAHRLQLSHYTGTRFEMTSDGSLQEAVVGQTIRRSTGDYNTEVGGNEITTVCGNSTVLNNGMTYETYSRGVSQLFGLRLLNYPGLNEDNIPADKKAAFTDPDTGEPIYLPANLKQKGGSYTGKWDNSVLYNVGGAFIVSAGGNVQITSGSGFSMMSMTGAQVTATEGLELSGMAATYGDIGTSITPIKPVVLYGYNGVSELASFDLTGLASCSGVIVDPGSAPQRGRPDPSALFFANLGSKSGVDAGTINGGCIKVLGIPGPAPNTFLGGTELSTVFPNGGFVVLGEQLLVFLTKVMGFLTLHTHPSAVGATGPSADFITQWATNSTTFLTEVASTTVRSSK